MRCLEITGTVFSGFGEAGRYMSMPEYKRRFKKYLGFSPCPGTLNLKIAEDDLQKISSLEAILIPGFSFGNRNFDSIKCYRAGIDTVLGAIVIPESSKYRRAGIPAVEIIAPVLLRKKFFLKDGDNLAFEVYDPQDIRKECLEKMEALLFL